MMLSLLLFFVVTTFAFKVEPPGANPYKYDEDILIPTVHRLRGFGENKAMDCKESPYRPSVFIPNEAKRLGTNDFTVLKPLSEECRKCHRGTQFIYSPIARRKSSRLQVIGRFACSKVICVQSASGRLIQIISTKGKKQIRILPIGQCSGSRCSIVLGLEGPVESNDIKLSPFILDSSSLPQNFVPLPIRGFSCGPCDEEIPLCFNEEEGGGEGGEGDGKGVEEEGDEEDEARLSRKESQDESQ